MVLVNWKIICTDLLTDFLDVPDKKRVNQVVLHKFVIKAGSRITNEGTTQKILEKSKIKIKKQRKIKLLYLTFDTKKSYRLN
jgi:hypothetical protein